VRQQGLDFSLAQPADGGRRQHNHRFQPAENQRRGNPRRGVKTRALHAQRDGQTLGRAAHLGGQRR
jgi:hypothetical protein